MKRILKGLSAVIVAMGFILPNTSQAILELQLTQGLDAALPIAVIPFAWPQGTPQKTSSQLSAVIASDLQNSGRFKVYPQDKLTNKPHDAKSVNYAFWRSKSVNDVVVGNVTNDQKGGYDISFQVLNVYSPNNIAAPNKKAGNAVLGQAFTQIPPAQVRALAHHISDLIYQKLTGERGAFSTKIAYVLVEKQDGKKHYLLEVADADGHNPQTLVSSNEPIMSPAWAPNGKEIAYVSFAGQQSAIYSANLYTGKRTMLSDAPGINGAPSFSPDGKYLALVLSKSGHPNIYTLNLQTHKLKQVTRGWAIDTEPSWAPDGKGIVFTSNRGGKPQIYKVNLASGQILRQTFDGPYNARASYTPNGKDLVMMHGNGRGQFNIASLDLDSGVMRTLTQGGFDKSPSVSPNGAMIIYGTHSDGHGVLGVVSTDGRVKLRLPAQEGDVREPAWSPYLTS